MHKAAKNKDTLIDKHPTMKKKAEEVAKFEQPIRRQSRGKKKPFGKIKRLWEQTWKRGQKAYRAYMRQKMRTHNLRHCNTMHHSDYYLFSHALLLLQYDGYLWVSRANSSIRPMLGLVHLVLD